MATKRATARTKRTMRRMHPLVREVQLVQNDLIALASRLERLMPKIEAAALEQDFGEAERQRMQPLTRELLRLENEAAAKVVATRVGRAGK